MVCWRCGCRLSRPPSSLHPASQSCVPTRLRMLPGVACFRAWPCVAAAPWRLSRTRPTSRSTLACPQQSPFGPSCRPWGWALPHLCQRPWHPWRPACQLPSWTASWCVGQPLMHCWACGARQPLAGPWGRRRLPWQLAWPPSSVAPPTLRLCCSQRCCTRTRPMRPCLQSPAPCQPFASQRALLSALCRCPPWWPSSGPRAPPLPWTGAAAWTACLSGRLGRARGRARTPSCSLAARATRPSPPASWRRPALAAAQPQRPAPATACAWLSQPQ